MHYKNLPEQTARREIKRYPDIYLYVYMNFVDARTSFFLFLIEVSKKYLKDSNEKKFWIFMKSNAISITSDFI